MDISSIRHQNLLKILDSQCSQVDLAKAIDTAPAYISQLKKGETSDGRSVSMGNDLARRIEEKLGLEHGWMDSPQFEAKTLAFDAIYEIRRKNMLILQSEAGLDRKDFAEKIGLSYPLLSHYIGKTPTKRIGDIVARRAEVALGKPHGYLDQGTVIQMFLPDRIRQLRKEKGLSQADLAKIAGVSPPAVTQWEGGTTAPKIAPAEKMAAFFGLPISFFSNINGNQIKPNATQQQANIRTTDEPVRLIPVLSWTQASNWMPATGFDDTSVDQWLPWQSSCGEYGFALVVSGESMLPKFEPNDYICINPEYGFEGLRTGDMVVAFCNGEGVVMARRVIVEPDDIYLEPLNNAFKKEKPVSLKHDCRLVGKIVAMHRSM